MPTRAGEACSMEIAGQICRRSLTGWITLVITERGTELRASLRSIVRWMLSAGVRRIGTRVGTELGQGQGQGGDKCRKNYQWKW